MEATYAVHADYEAVGAYIDHGSVVASQSVVVVVAAVVVATHHHHHLHVPNDL